MPRTPHPPSSPPAEFSGSVPALGCTMQARITMYRSQSGITNSLYFFYTAQIQCIQDQSAWTNHNKRRTGLHDPEEIASGALITCIIINNVYTLHFK